MGDSQRNLTSRARYLFDGAAVRDRLALVREHHLRDLVTSIDEAIDDVRSLDTRDYTDPTHREVVVAEVCDTLSEVAEYLHELRMRG